MVQGASAEKITEDDPFAYFMVVKEKFQDKPEKYVEFLAVMKDYKAHKVQFCDLVLRVRELFKGHDGLIWGFNAIFRKSLEQTLLPEDDKPLPKKLTEFLYKMDKKIQEDFTVSKSTVKILTMYKKGNKTIRDVYKELAILFRGHHDLLVEFTLSFPDTSTTASTNDAVKICGQIQIMIEEASEQKLTADDILAYVEAVQYKFQDKPEKYDEFVEHLDDFQAHRVDFGGLMWRLKDIFRGKRELLLGFNALFPESCKRTFLPEDYHPRLPEKLFEFLNKIMTRFEDGYSVCQSFIIFLGEYKKGKATVEDACKEVVNHFLDYDDLFVEFTHMLPKYLATWAVSYKNLMMRLKKNQKKIDKKNRCQAEISPDFLKAETMVCWDYDNCPVTNGYSNPERIISQIHSAVKKLGYNGEISISCYGNKLDCTDLCLITDLLFWIKRKEAPKNIFLIAGDGDYLPVVKGLKKLSYNVLLAYPKSPSTKLLSSAMTILPWERLLLDEPVDPVSKPEENLSCKYCPKVFKSATFLEGHIKKKHLSLF